MANGDEGRGLGFLLSYLLFHISKWGLEIRCARTLAVVRRWLGGRKKLFTEKGDRWLNHATKQHRQTVTYLRFEKRERPV